MFLSFTARVASEDDKWGVLGVHSEHRSSGCSGTSGRL